MRCLIFSCYLLIHSTLRRFSSPFTFTFHSTRWLNVCLARNAMWHHHSLSSKHSLNSLNSSLSALANKSALKWIQVCSCNFLLPQINEWKKCRRSRLCNCRGGLVLIRMQFRVCSFECVRVSLKSDWICKQVVSRHESSTTLYMFLCKKGGFIERISRENLNNVCNRALATIMIRVFFALKLCCLGRDFSVTFCH